MKRKGAHYFLHRSREVKKWTAMEEKTLDEQFDELLNHPLGTRMVEVYLYTKPIYRNEVWPTYGDTAKRIVIRQIKGMIEKVKF